LHSKERRAQEKKGEETPRRRKKKKISQNSKKRKYIRSENKGDDARRGGSDVKREGVPKEKVLRNAEKKPKRPSEGICGEKRMWQGKNFAKRKKRKKKSQKGGSCWETSIRENLGEGGGIHCAKKGQNGDSKKHDGWAEKKIGRKGIMAGDTIKKQEAFLGGIFRKEGPQTTALRRPLGKGRGKLQKEWSDCVSQAKWVSGWKEKAATKR